MSNGTSKPRRAMQLGATLIAVAGLLVSLTALASAQNTNQRAYSGNIISPDTCLAMSLGGPVLLPSDSDRDGVYDTCVQPYSRREATARQNAKEAFSAVLTDYFGQLFAQECALGAATFGQPTNEAIDECAAPRASYARGTSLASLPAVPPMTPPRTSSLCTNQSYGGQTTYPTDTNNDGFADTCSLPRTNRAAVARQNALDRLAAEYPVAFNTVLQEQCQLVPASFGEPAKEATDVCSPYYQPSPTGTPLPTPTTPTDGSNNNTGTTPTTPTTPTRPSWNSPTATKPAAAKATAPQGLTLDPGQTSIDVAWTAPTDDASSVAGYRVWWAQSNQSYSTSRRTALLTSSTNSYSITGLVTYTTYKVKVEAVRTADRGIDSPTLTTTPGIPGPPIWPSYGDSTKPNTQAGDPLHNDEYGDIDVTWGPPTGTTITVDHYLVQWRSSGQGWSTDRQVTTASPVNTHTITGLGYGSIYYVRVLAVGSNTPPGMWTHYESVRLTSNLPAPGQPTKLTLSEGANLSISATWVAPTIKTYTDTDDNQLPGDEGSNQPTHYVVQWRNRTDGGSWQQTTVGNSCGSKSDDTTATISNLVSGKRYEVRVRGVNCKRPGSWSGSAYITLSVVDSPTIDSWVPESRTDSNSAIQNDVKIQWTVPTTYPTPTNVNLQWNTSSSFPSNCNSNSNACTQVGYASSTTEHTISSLTPGKTYYVRMQSVSQFGPGPWSRATSFKPGTRQAPTGVSASASGSLVNAHTKLDVTWSATSESNKLATTKYMIQWRKKGSTSWPWSRTTSDNSTTPDVNEALNTEYTITGLSAETTYEVRVLAINAYGNGPWSSTAEGTTSAKN